MTFVARRLAAAAALATGLALCAGPAQASAPPSADSGRRPAASAIRTAYVEQGADDPVSTAPPVSRPHTRHCTVTLADDFPSNTADGSPQQFSGTLTPPARCKGPWAKVVLDYTTTVSGRQYDRSGSLDIGGVNVWFGTTQEPGGPKPTTFHFAKDITRYAALLKDAQPFTGGIGNYTSDIYTGVYRQTVTITYYRADRSHPAPKTPDRVVGVPVSDLTPDSPSTTTTLSDLPRNITRADLQVTLKGNGCDEQWFTAVPDEVADNFPGDGLCKESAYREAMISIDGLRAGAVGTYPHIYSGGIVPTLWRPVLAIDTLDLRPENLDLTPFAGRLVDGKQHRITVSMDPIGDRWNVEAVLFIYTDHHRARTSGKLTVDDVAAAARTSTNSHSPEAGTVDYGERAHRRDTTAGWVDTSAGRVYTTVHRTRSWRNSGSVGDHGLVQSITQRDKMIQRSTSKVGHHTVRSGSVREDYPISVDFSAANYVDDQNFSLEGTVAMGQRVTTTTREGGRPSSRHWDWNVDSHGVLARADGVTSESDGHSTSSYRGTDDRGRPYWHFIRTNHGKVLSDRHSH